MERTEYFNHTRPSQTQLNNTEDTKIRGILRRARSNAQFGIRTGFIVTVNAANATLIDIGPGEGYTGGFFRDENLKGEPNSGEIISTLTDVATGQAGYTYTVSGLGLADYSANTKNYVSLVFAESKITPLAERYYPFTSHTTIINEAYTSEVLVEADWTALTADEKEQRILVAIVTAQGAGNALAAANIQQLVQPKSHPTPGNQPSAITGVSITGLSQETLIGNATLRFEASTKKIYWTSPGDAEGAGVVISSNGTYITYSDETSYWVGLEIIFASLPSSDLTETISVESLYGRTVPMACATDQAHRDMLGSGVPTTSNPHGLTADDLPGGAFDHADLYHVNGISGDAESDQLLCTIATEDRIEIQNKGSFKNSFLIDGFSYTTIVGYAAGTPAYLGFDVTPALDSGDYMLYLDSAGAPQYVKIAEYAPADGIDEDVLWSPNIRIYDMHNTTAGNGTITWDNALDTLRYQAPGDAAGPLVQTMMDYNLGFTNAYGYYKLYSNNGIDWVLVFCNGSSLGAADSSTFAIDKNETEHPDDTILKLGIVTWNAIGEAHFNIRDIRSFITADNRDIIENEHDTDGRHTKLITHAIRIGVTGDAALQATASDSAIIAVAIETGVYALAAHTGVHGEVLGNVGVFGGANNTGVFGDAFSHTGVFGTANSSYGVRGVAAWRGVAGTASTYGGFFEASNILGLFATAPNSAASLTADTNLALEAAAGGNTAISAGANNYGIYARANVAIGIYGIASNTGIYGSAATAVGVLGIAANNHGGSFSCPADNATALAGVGGGTLATGVYGLANISAGTGVAGVGGTEGVGIGGVFTGNYGGIRAVANGNAGVAAYVKGNGDVNATALFITDGVLRYDEPVVAAGIISSYLPIVLGVGVTRRIGIYSSA